MNMRRPESLPAAMSERGHFPQGAPLYEVIISRRECRVNASTAGSPEATLYHRLGNFQGWGGGGKK